MGTGLAPSEAQAALRHQPETHEVPSDISRLQMAVMELERQLAGEDDAIAALRQEHSRTSVSLSAMESELADLTAQLQQRQRTHSRQVSAAKLLQLQLTVATQLYGVAASLTQVTAAAASSGGCVDEAAVARDSEVNELRRALKRQKNLVTDAHRQLLELSTRKKPLGAVAEQEMARMMAGAACADETARGTRATPTPSSAHRAAGG
jgi:chromosome segregation ATPase